MKKNNWKMVAIVITVLIITPIFIGFGVSQDILNDWTNDNDWIGFWGSYAGTLIGSGVTLLVLWSTLEDNKHARVRAEKLNYYNNLIESFAIFMSDTDNYLASVLSLLNVKDYDSRKNYVQAKNQVAKSSTILEVQLYIKKGNTNIDKIMEQTESIEDELFKIPSDINKMAGENFTNTKEINDLKKRVEAVFDKMNDFEKIFPDLIKKELDE